MFIHPISKCTAFFEYRELTTKKLDTFIDRNINQLWEEGTTKDIDLKPALYDYHAKHMSDATFVSWLALDKKIISTSEIFFVEKSPCFGYASGKSDKFVKEIMFYDNTRINIL